MDRETIWNGTNAVFQLPHTDIIRGSVEIDLGGLTFDETVMHDHYFSRETAIVPRINHKTGELRPGDLWDWGKNSVPTKDDVTIRYKYATTDFRWVRNYTPGGVASLKWWGAVDGEDVRARLCWALNDCHQLGIKTLRLDGSYRYRGSIEIPDGMELTDGVLKVVDTDALKHLLLDYVQEPIEIQRGVETCIFPAYQAMYTGMRRVELDGNWENNTRFATNPEEYAADVQTTLRNTMCWGGFASIEQKAIAGQKVFLEDVHIHGTGSNCINSGGTPTWNVRGLKLGNCLRNHLWYSCKGTFTDVTFHGFTWDGAMKTSQALINGLKVEDWVENPHFPVPGSPIIAVSGPEELQVGAIASNPEYSQRGVVVNGFHIDLTNSDANIIFGGTGDKLTVRDGTVLGRETSAFGYSLFGDWGNGLQEGIKRNWLVDNVLILERGSAVGSSIMYQRPYAMNLMISNVTTDTDYDYSASADPNIPYIFKTNARPDPLASFPQRVTISNNLDKPRVSLREHRCDGWTCAA